MFRQLIRVNKLFILPWLIMVVLGIIWIVMNHKGDGVKLLNTLHNDTADQFFIYCTKMGENWGAYLVVLMIVLFRELRHFIGFIMLILLVVSFVYVLKHYVFPDAERPISFLGEKGLNLVENMRVNRDHSFPSGHTTAGFAFFSYMAFSFRQRGVKIAALVLATLVAVSRVYLVQHFVEDVVAGSILGTTLSLIVFRFFTEAEYIMRRNIFGFRLFKFK